MVDSTIKRGRKTTCNTSCAAAYGNKLRAENRYKPFKWFLKKRRSMVKHRVEVTVQDIYRLWKNQQGKCSLTGIDMLYPSETNQNSLFCASLDRIDSGGEYTLDNVQLIARGINWLKNNHTQEQAREFILAISRSVND